MKPFSCYPHQTTWLSTTGNLASLLISLCYTLNRGSLLNFALFLSKYHPLWNLLIICRWHSRISDGHPSLFATSSNCFTRVSPRRTSTTDQPKECREDASGQTNSSESMPLSFNKRSVQKGTVLSLSTRDNLATDRSVNAVSSTDKVWVNFAIFSLGYHPSWNPVKKLLAPASIQRRLALHTQFPLG